MLLRLWRLIFSTWILSSVFSRRLFWNRWLFFYSFLVSFLTSRLVSISFCYKNTVKQSERPVLTSLVKKTLLSTSLHCSPPQARATRPILLKSNGWDLQKRAFPSFWRTLYIECSGLTWSKLKHRGRIFLWVLPLSTLNQNPGSNRHRSLPYSPLPFWSAVLWARTLFWRGTFNARISAHLPRKFHCPLYSVPKFTSASM